MKKPPYLVTSPDAMEFVDRMRLKSGANAALSKPEDHDGTPIAQHVLRAHQIMQYGVDAIGGLANDQTKTTVVRHESGRVVANKVTGVLEAGRDAMRNHAVALVAQGEDEVSEAFALDPNNSTHHSDMRRWLFENSKHPEAPRIIREAANESPELVKVMYQSPAFLLGISSDLRMRIVGDYTEKLVPNAVALWDYASSLRSLADKYDQTIRSVNASFYNASVADQAKSRVTV